MSCHVAVFSLLSVSFVCIHFLAYFAHTPAHTHVEDHIFLSNKICSPHHWSRRGFLSLVCRHRIKGSILCATVHSICLSFVCVCFGSLPNISSFGFLVFVLFLTFMWKKCGTSAQERFLVHNLSQHKFCSSASVCWQEQSYDKFHITPPHTSIHPSIHQCPIIGGRVAGDRNMQMEL